MKRREVLMLVGAVPLLVAAAPEALPAKRVRFIEVGPELVVEFTFPEILATNDEQAMAAIDSGFATRLVFELSLFAAGSHQPIVSTSQSVRLWWDPWNRQYMISSDEGSPTRVRGVPTRAEAIRGAVRVRASLCPTASLERGEDHTYFLHVVAFRNPHDQGRSTDIGVRSQERDLSVFSRWVSVFLGEPPRAELTVERRSNYFYLVAR